MNGYIQSDVDTKFSELWHKKFKQQSVEQIIEKIESLKEDVDNCNVSIIDELIEIGQNIENLRSTDIIGHKILEEQFYDGIVVDFQMQCDCIRNKYIW